MASVGSSISKGSRGCGVRQIRDALADLNSLHAGDGHEIARANCFRFIALQVRGRCTAW